MAAYLSITGRAVRRPWMHIATAAGVAIFMAAVLPAQPVQAGLAPQEARGPALGTSIPLLNVARVRVPSKAFATVRDVYMWVPNTESPTAARYPVLVFPDAEENGQFRAALANVQFLIDRRLIPPMIVAGVPFVKDRRHELSPPATGTTAKYYPMAGGAGQTLQFVIDELLPWIDAHYPTLPMHVFAGHSLGGNLALYAMETRPDAFRVVIAMSPAMYWNDGAFGNEVAQRLVADTVRPRTLFLMSGGQEPSIDQPVTTFAARLRALMDSTKDNRLTFERRQYPEDAHEMTPLPGLVDGLRMAFRPMLVPADSVVTAFSGRNTTDSAEIATAVNALESRYSAAASSLGLPGLFPEQALDLLGSYALQAKQANLAVTLFRENRDHYAKSSNTHESLGEALVAAGDTTRAVEEFRSSISLAHEEAKSISVLVRAQARDVIAQARSQLESLHRSET